jgi:hypothetical protein
MKSLLVGDVNWSMLNGTLVHADIDEDVAPRVFRIAHFTLHLKLNALEQLSLDADALAVKLVNALIAFHALAKTTEVALELVSKVDLDRLAEFQRRMFFPVELQFLTNQDGRERRHEKYDFHAALSSCTEPQRSKNETSC